MAWRRPGAKPLSEPVMVSLLTHICVTLPQLVNQYWIIVNWTSKNKYQWNFNIKNPHISSAKCLPCCTKAHFINHYFFNHKFNFDWNCENSYCCISITIATIFEHASTAVGSCTKLFGDRHIVVWIKAKQNFHRTVKWISGLNVLTHWGRDKMVAILQTTFSNHFFNENVWFSAKKSLNFVPKGSINSIPVLIWILFGTDKATSHYLNLWWLDYCRIWIHHSASMS